MEEIQTQPSEVKKPNLEEQNTAMAEAVEQINDADAVDSQPQEKQDQKTTNNSALLELEEVLRGLEPDDVVKFQREISAELGENLFEGEIGELFKKYKPMLTREQKVKTVADLFRNGKKDTEPAKQTKSEVASLEQELLTAKVKLELVKQGVSEDYLDDATIIALSKIKDSSEIDKCKDIAIRYSSLSAREEPRQTHTTIPVGEKEKEMTEGEKAVAFLKKLNPNGYKK